MTSKPEGQKNVTAILLRASRKAIEPRLVPDIADANQHYLSTERSQTRSNGTSLSNLDKLGRQTHKVKKIFGLTGLNNQSLVVAYHYLLARKSVPNKSK